VKNFILGVTLFALTTAPIGTDVHIVALEQVATNATIAARFNDARLLAPTVFLMCDGFNVRWIYAGSNAALVICLQ
jgi:hypothetical protein